MATEFFLKLWDNHIIQLGVWQTVYMTFLTSLFAYVIGLPLGVVLWVTDKDGLHPNKGVNTVLGFIVNFFRSIPAVILMVAMIPAARLLLGTSTGNGAVIVTLIIAAAPYVARMVESSLKEVPAGVIEAAQAMGCTNLQIIWHVLLPEAKPSLISGCVISTVTILSYTALAAARHSSSVRVWASAGKAKAAKSRYMNAFFITCRFSSKGPGGSSPRGSANRCPRRRS